VSGIFSSPKYKQAVTEAVGPTLRQKQAEEAEARASTERAAAMHRRRMMGGMGVSSGVIPEELPSPSSASSKKLGVG